MVASDPELSSALATLPAAQGLERHWRRSPAAVVGWGLRQAFYHDMVVCWLGEALLSSGGAKALEAAAGADCAPGHRVAARVAWALAVAREIVHRDASVLDLDLGNQK